LFQTIDYANEIFEKQNGLCALTNVKLYFGRCRFSHETNASLDRIDSNKGYIEGNIQWVLKDINFMKSNHNQDYFISLCKLVSQANIGI
jgi:hypothetical protein